MRNVNPAIDFLCILGAVGLIMVGRLAKTPIPQAALPEATVTIPKAKPIQAKEYNFELDNSPTVVLTLAKQEQSQIAKSYLDSDCNIVLIKDRNLEGINGDDHYINRFRHLGAKFYVIDSWNAAENFLKESAAFDENTKAVVLKDSSLVNIGFAFNNIRTLKSKTITYRRAKPEVIDLINDTCGSLTFTNNDGMFIFRPDSGGINDVRISAHEPSLAPSFPPLAAGGTSR